MQHRTPAIAGNLPVPPMASGVWDEELIYRSKTGAPYFSVPGIVTFVDSSDLLAISSGRPVTTK
jgi:hypothetical protein